MRHKTRISCLWKSLEKNRGISGVPPASGKLLALYPALKRRAIPGNPAGCAEVRKFATFARVCIVFFFRLSEAHAFAALLPTPNGVGCVLTPLYGFLLAVQAGHKTP
jgi:hypothetical protein